MRITHALWAAWEGPGLEHLRLTVDAAGVRDIFPSPFTNTLPIQRLARVAIGQRVGIDVAWVGLPELTIRRNRQEYTLLERRPDGARWRFRTPHDDFTAELPDDTAGLVLDYPGIAGRLR